MPAAWRDRSRLPPWRSRILGDRRRPPAVFGDRRRPPPETAVAHPSAHDRQNCHESRHLPLLDGKANRLTQQACLSPAVTSRPRYQRSRTTVCGTLRHLACACQRQCTCKNCGSGPEPQSATAASPHSAATRTRRRLRPPCFSRHSRVSLPPQIMCCTYTQKLTHATPCISKRHRRRLTRPARSPGSKGNSSCLACPVRRT